MKNFHFQSQSLNTTLIWVNRMKTRNKNRIIYLNASIVDIDDRFSSFFWKRSFSTHTNCEVYVGSYWLTKEWIANCCLSNLDEKSTSLYRNSSSTISFTDLSSHDSSRFFWESRSSIVTRLFSSDQNVFELRCHFDLISSESHTHLRALWLFDDLENQ